MNRYDIIGDIHGCAEELRALLGRLGYRAGASGVYRHPKRTAVFVGDLIDRGDGQLEVLQLVKGMVDAGFAQVVMGNHEFNAVAYSMGLRENNEKNTRQHRAFLNLAEADREFYLEWFTTIPLWLDLGGVRVVHACWHQKSIDAIEAVCASGRLGREHYVAATTEGSRLYDAVETLLKGPEIDLAELGFGPYYDHGGDPRTRARIRWWDRDARTLRDLADLRGMKTQDGEPYPVLDPDPVDGFDFSLLYTDSVPVVYGHYWFQWDNHREDWTEYTACVDFSAVKGGRLVAYRWDGEPTITWRNYEPHTKDVVAEIPSD